jgi:hypothetical protein
LEAENVMEQIQQAAWKNTPETKRLLAGNNYPMEIRQLVTEKRKLRKDGNKQGHQRIKTA